MTLLKSNLITIVDGGESNPNSLALTTKVVEQLKQNKIFVSEVIGYDHPLLSKIMVESDAHIILSLVSHKKINIIFGLNQNLFLAH